MSKKGFTLIEMLIVISLLALIFGLIIPRVVDVNRSAKERAFTSTKNLLVNAGEIYVQDHHYDMNTMSNSNFCVDVKTLIDNGYAKANVENGEAGCNNVKGCITSPVNNAILNNEFIEVSVVNGQYRGVWGSTLCGNPSSYSTNTNIGESSEGNCTEAVAFATDDWETIICNVKKGTDSVYHVGDTKTIELGNSLGTHTLRIANIGVNDPLDCITNSNYSHTACGFVLEFEDIIKEGSISNVNSSYGSWPALDSSVDGMRDYINTTVYNAIPEVIRNAIINTRVVSGHRSGDGSINYTCTDKLYLLHYIEIYGSNCNCNDTLTTSETRQLDYYKNKGLTCSANLSVQRKSYSGTIIWWWTRTLNYGDNRWRCINTSDATCKNQPNGSAIGGISPAFRIG